MPVSQYTKINLFADIRRKKIKFNIPWGFRLTPGEIRAIPHTSQPGFHESEIALI